MKIDAGGVASGQLQTDWSARLSSNASAAATKSIDSDRTTLSSSSSTVQNLVSLALTTPDVRQDKVQALRESVSDGTYQVNAQKLASAMLSDS